MTDGKWKTVGIVDNENMMVPHVLQQQYMYVRQRDEYEFVNEHRLVSINELDGVES